MPPGCHGSGRRQSRRLSVRGVCIAAKLSGIDRETARVVDDFGRGRIDDHVFLDAPDETQPVPAVGKLLGLQQDRIEFAEDEARLEHVVYLPLETLQAQTRGRVFKFALDHPKASSVSVSLRVRRIASTTDCQRPAGRPQPAVVENPLVIAARTGDVAAIQQAAKDGRNLELADRKGATLLSVAARANKVEVVRALLEGGAKIDAQDSRGFSPLIAAIQTRQNSIEVVQALIEKGADVNLRDTTGVGGTALSWAAGPFSNPQIVAALVAANADVNQTNNVGMTALMWAAQFGSPATVKLLVDAGADLSVKMPSGQIALDLARQRRDSAAADQVVEILGGSSGTDG